MAINDSPQTVSRRDVVRGAAGLGLLAPLAFGPSHATGAQEDAPDYGGHPAVGVWIEGGSGPTFTYQVVHADGTLIYYNPWLEFLGQGDPNVPAIGFGVWHPISERATEGVIRMAWLDINVTTLLTIKGRTEIDETGRYASGQYKATLADAAGNELMSDSGAAWAERMEVEPFDGPDLPDATPDT